MIKSYIVDETCNDMRLDRWIRNKLCNIPQSLVEKSLRSGKIKVNKKKKDKTASPVDKKTEEKTAATA